MRIAFACKCGKKLQADEKHAGKRAKCPGCGATVTIPQPVVAHAVATHANTAQPFPENGKRETVSAEERTQRGYKHQEEGRLDEAIREYLEALRVDPNFALARSNLGVVYKQQGKMDDAIQQWEETLRRGVDSVVVRLNTEDWLKEAKALRDEKKKDIGDVAKAVGSYMEELGQASDRWFIAYEALARIGAPAIDNLIEAVESDNGLLRSRSIDLLGKIGDQRAVAPLKRASTISEREFRRISRLSGRTQVSYIGGMRIEVPVSDLWEEYRKYAVAALKKINTR